MELTETESDLIDLERLSNESEDLLRDWTPVEMDSEIKQWLRLIMVSPNVREIS